MIKRALSLTVLAAACGSAWAQSSVTIYGIADAGITRVSGLRGGTDTRLVSGLMDGSRFGLRGNEDIGGGWRAVFTAESRLELNNGTLGSRPASGTQVPDRLNQAALLGLPTALQPAVTGIAGSIGSTLGVNLRNGFWDRQVFVGVVTPVGAVLAGRQYTPAYEVTATFDVMQTQSPLAAGQVASIPASVDIRVDNALQYRIVMGGLTASAMYAFGGVSGNNKANRLGGAMVMYNAGAWSAGLGYNARNNDVGQSSLKSLVIGGAADIGPGRISAMYGDIQDDNPSGVSGIAAGLIAAGQTGAVANLVQTAFTNALKQDARLMHIGYKLPTGPHTFYVAYTQVKDKRNPTSAGWKPADTASYGAVYSYALSKRTDLSAAVVRFDNKGWGQAAPGATGYLGGVTASAATDSTVVGAGIRHRF